MKSLIKIRILPPTVLVKSDGTFDQEEALKACARLAGICYSPSGIDALLQEDESKTEKRKEDTLNNEHHSVYDMVEVILDIQGIPKIMAMLINNEKQYTTLEKSGRYTDFVDPMSQEYVTEEAILYEKWKKLIKIKLKDKYGEYFSEKALDKKAMEVARSMVSVMMTTSMSHKIPLGQLNKIIAMMKRQIDNPTFDPIIMGRLQPYFESFVSEIERLNLSVEELQSNRKQRDFSLFKFADIKEEIFDSVYQAKYDISYMGIGQLLRHRSIDYSIRRHEEPEFYIPVIIQDDPALVEDWLNDINSVDHNIVLGGRVTVNERGNVDTFVLKMQERQCVHTQEEPFASGNSLAIRFHRALLEKESPDVYKLEKCLKGVRCLSGYRCPNPCNIPPSERVRRKF